MQISPTFFLRRHSVVGYFFLAFVISWSGALVLAAPYMQRGQTVPTMSGILMFPVMLLGPSIGGIAMTLIVDGRQGLRDLFARIRRARVAPRWYTVLLIPPVLVLAVLLFLKTFVSPSFSPNHFYAGILFGLPAGIFEEIGWMGYAFPKMQARHNPLTAAIVLGILWSVWHLPVIDYLGAAAPHGSYWLRFFLAFTLVLTAMRVLIAWLYVNTNSVLLAQLMHVSSTGALIIFSPPVTAGQEAMWYAAYGCVLWVTAGLIAASYGRPLRQE
jgi:membrane protease YdiL (CAAX protease family)